MAIEITKFNGRLVKDYEVEFNGEKVTLNAMLVITNPKTGEDVPVFKADTNVREFSYNGEKITEDNYGKILYSLSIDSKYSDFE